jgi:transposase-like protein
LVVRVKAEDISLVGPGGLLCGLTKRVLETVLEAEVDEHLGYAGGERDAKATSRTTPPR